MKYLLIILAIIGSSSLFAQSIERQVLGSMGGTASAGSVIVTSTIGEMAVTTASGSIILTQGFQQANTAPSVSIEELIVTAEYALFPNPTNGIVTLAIIPENINSTAIVQIYSLTGQLISSQELSLTSGVESTVKLDMSNQVAGAYMVRVIDSNSSISKTMRLMKQ